MTKRNAFTPRPSWLDEEPTLQLILHTFLDKIENTERLSIRVTAKTLPDLFSSNNNDPHYIWALINELDKSYKVITVKPAATKSNTFNFENAQLFFIPEQEASVRQWLNRPRLDPYALLWNNYLNKYAHHFEDNGEALVDNIIHLPHKAPEHILRGFTNIAVELKQPMSLRALSARCFWGDSKFLDRKEELVQALYPNASHLITSRPILLDCYIPQSIERVLFIENQDSFLTLADKHPRTTALIYSAGFHGSSTRIRDKGNTRFTQLTSAPAAASFSEFTLWWHRASSQQWPVYFWGDMDFAGAAILKMLRQSFTNISTWLPGYRPLLQRLEAGEGHGHNSCGKENQLDPATTGCNYMDNTLLPTMRKLGTFIDQEAVLAKDLEGFN